MAVRSLMTRGLLGVLGAVLWAGAAIPSAHAEPSQTYSFKIQIEERFLKAIDKDVLETAEVQKTDSRGGPLVIIAGAAALIYILDAAIDIVREVVYGGIVINAKGDELLIERDKALDSGTIIVVTNEKTYFFEESKMSLDDVVKLFNKK